MYAIDISMFSVASLSVQLLIWIPQLTLLTVDLGMDDTDIAKRYLEYCSKSPKPMSLKQYVTRFGHKEKTRKKRVGKVIDCASKLLQAFDQIDPHELVNIQSTLNDVFIALQLRFSSATDPASQTRDAVVCLSALIDISDAFQQGHVTSGAIDSVQPSSLSATFAVSEIRNGIDFYSFDS